VNENFLTSLKFTLQYEGGYSNHPDDPGGPTNFGITQRVYNTYRTNKKLQVQSVKSITTDEVHEIYQINYWNLCRCDTLPSGVDFAVFDLAVNNGVGRANEFIPIAMQKPNASLMIDSICDQRLDYDKSLVRLWKVFGKGWTKRIEGVRQQAKIMANDEKKSQNTTSQE
jgi:lysozyme family protein